MTVLAVLVQKQVQMMYLLKLKPVQIVLILTGVQSTGNEEGKGHQVHIQREDLL